MTCLGSHNKPGPHPEVWLQVHSPKHHFSCFSMFLRFAIREEHIFTKELRSVLTPPLTSYVHHCIIIPSTAHGTQSLLKKCVFSNT